MQVKSQTDRYNGRRCIELVKHSVNMKHEADNRRYQQEQTRHSEYFQ